MMNSTIKKYILFFCLGITVLLGAIVGVSYAYFKSGISQTSVNGVTALTCLNLTFTSNNNSVSLQNTYPMTLEEGYETPAYNFTIASTCPGYVKYYLVLSVENNANLLDPSYVRVAIGSESDNTNYVLSSLEETDTPASVSEFKSIYKSYIIDEGSFNNASTVSYDFKMWLDGTNPSSWTEDIENDILTGTLTVVGIAVTPNDPSGANEPLLADNMIPVYYDETYDQWLKAPISNDQGIWHDYSKQKWANAVTVTSATRTTYNNASVNTPVNMDDIMGMWVWIPRYEYRTDNLGTQYAGGTLALPGEMGVNFISGIDTTNTTNYLIHPAFRDGTLYKHTAEYDLGGWDKELTGFWYGKFETGYATNITAETGAISSGILIKPDVYGMKYQTVSNEFQTALNVQTDHGIGNQIEIHMSKNDEWGAVAYLSNSKYGKYGNADYTGANKEIYVNNAYYSSGYIFTTGRSNGTYSGGASSGPTQYGTYEYNNCPASAYAKTTCNLVDRQTNATKGTGASTTGNIYGVYDMSGGLLESIMGNYANIVSSSGFSAMPNQKYYNKYTSTTLSTMCNGAFCPGVGWSNETGNTESGGYYNWYTDEIYLLTDSRPWPSRGSFARNGSSMSTGIFSSTNSSGSSNYADGFRVVGS